MSGDPGCPRDPRMASWMVPYSLQPEMMDDPALPAAEHFHALDALARINMLSLTATQIVRKIARMPTGRQPTPLGGHALQVVDVACGGGDVTVAVARQLARRRPSGAEGAPAVQMTGIDISHRAVEWATRHSEGRTGSASVSFIVQDILAAGCPTCDVAISSLFLHHLDDDTAVHVLTSLARAARIGIVVSDLLRTAAGLTLAVVGTAVLTGSRVARVDGPASVRSARTKAEYRGLLDRAGLQQAKIYHAWPERVILTWTRPTNGSMPFVVEATR